ncbi:Beta-glucan synthesis-associated protein, partial [Globisporangium polare]
YKTWYQGMKYAANNYCAPDAKLKQDYKTVRAALDAGVTENACTLTNSPASKDPNADLGLLDGSKTDHWGINSNGTCYPLMNGYTGSHLCSPGNPSSRCKKSEVVTTSTTKVFEYQMDALSANWPIHVAAYLDYLLYQLEWVPGGDGYIRWMLAGQPIYEMPASAMSNPPQDASKGNPVKIMIEEPMYMIFNVALSSTWSTKPPNPGKPCRGDGKDPVANLICDSFPMFLKIDYIRVYQDTSTDSIMQVGCDPKTHPTKQWILDNIESYQDFDNMVVDVSGKAFCKTSDDCTIATTSNVAIRTGVCSKNRCKCSGSSWTGPRCTSVLGLQTTGGSFEPPLYVTVATSDTVLFGVLFVLCVVQRSNKVDPLLAARKHKAALRATIEDQERSDASDAKQSVS